MFPYERQIFTYRFFTVESEIFRSRKIQTIENCFDACAVDTSKRCIYIIKGGINPIKQVIIMPDKEIQFLW